MGEHRFGVTIVRGAYFVVSGSGVLTIAAASVVRADLDRLAEEYPNIDRGLFDGTTVEGFEHGQAIEWIKWSRSRARPARAVAFVTRIRSAIAASSTLHYMLPGLRFGAFATRDAAVAFLLSANDDTVQRVSTRKR